MGNDLTCSLGSLRNINQPAQPSKTSTTETAKIAAFIWRKESENGIAVASSHVAGAQIMMNAGGKTDG